MLFCFLYQSLCIIQERRIAISNASSPNECLISNPSICRGPTNENVTQEVGTCHGVLSSVYIIFGVVACVYIRGPSAARVFTVGGQLCAVFLVSIFLLLPKFSATTRHVCGILFIRSCTPRAP